MFSSSAKWPHNNKASWHIMTHLFLWLCLPSRSKACFPLAVAGFAPSPLKFVRLRFFSPIPCKMMNLEIMEEANILRKRKCWINVEKSIPSVFEFFKRDISESVRVEGPVMVTDCHRFNAMVLWPQGALGRCRFFSPRFLRKLVDDPTLHLPLWQTRRTWRWISSFWSH